MTFDPHRGNAPSDAYVWIWLQGATQPVVAGRVSRDGERLIFNYGRSYLDRNDAVPIFEPELPLRRGAIVPGAGLSMAGCLRDGAPDAWGRRVILNGMLGLRGRDADIGALDELTYMLESGSDRIGALDFQASPTIYQQRAPKGASLEELLGAVERVENGTPLTPELDQALFHGNSAHPWVHTGHEIGISQATSPQAQGIRAGYQPVTVIFMRVTSSRQRAISEAM